MMFENLYVEIARLRIEELLREAREANRGRRLLPRRPLPRRGDPPS